MKESNSKFRNTLFFGFMLFLLITILILRNNYQVLVPDKIIISLSNENTLSGIVKKIRDGDTIVVNTTPVRLNGLTCDEVGTPLGDQAKLFLQNKISFSNITCTLNGSKSYDRRIGRCETKSLGDIGAFMIASKLCGRCPRYDPKEKYLGVQKSAGPFTGVMPNYCK